MLINIAITVFLVARVSSINGRIHALNHSFRLSQHVIRRIPGLLYLLLMNFINLVFIEFVFKLYY